MSFLAKSLESRASFVGSSVVIWGLAVPLLVLFYEMARFGTFDAELVLIAVGAGMLTGVMWGFGMWAVFVGPFRERSKVQKRQ